LAAEERRSAIDPHLVTRIVVSYVGHHQIAPSDIAALISGVGQSLANAAGQGPEPEPTRTPAAPISCSVQNDHIVCLECGFRSQALRRHLSVRHRLKPDEYRSRWELPATYPLVAPRYSKMRFGDGPATRARPQTGGGDGDTGR
jgi:predicted transcriptional regulator